jgi:hypothetical protein
VLPQNVQVSGIVSDAIILVFEPLITIDKFNLPQINKKRTNKQQVADYKSIKILKMY